MSASGRHARGVELFNLGDYAGAIGEYTRAIRLDPRRPEFWNDRGIARKRLGRYAAALKDYARAIRIDPSYWPPHANRGNLLSRMRDFRGAVDALTRGLRVAPRQAILFYFRGNARACLFEYAGAVRDYGRAIRLNPRMKEAYFCRAVVARTLAVLCSSGGTVSAGSRTYRNSPGTARAWLRRAKADLKRADGWNREELEELAGEIEAELQGASGG
jgi:tetratricopeptide (TPR) repeat protein